MTTHALRLTALLERLERAGADLYLPANPSAFRRPFLFFADNSDAVFELEFTDSHRALLLGWAVGQIEAAGLKPDREWSEDDKTCKVTLYPEWLPECVTSRAPTELEATLLSLAEILESKNG